LSQRWEKLQLKNKLWKKNSSKAFSRHLIFIQDNTWRQIRLLTRWKKWWKKSIWVNLHVLHEISKSLYQNKRSLKFSKRFQLAVKSSRFQNLSKLLKSWVVSIQKKNWPSIESV
jgi:hypothetical protein